MNSDELVSSGLLPITIGVPQESVLGPSFFLVYVNNLPNSCNFDMSLYADDSIMMWNDKIIRNKKSTDEKEFQIVENWLQFKSSFLLQFG